MINELMAQLNSDIQTCVACEGIPTPGNSPCAICSSIARPVSKEVRFGAEGQATGFSHPEQLTVLSWLGLDRKQLRMNHL